MAASTSSKEMGKSSSGSKGRWAILSRMVRSTGQWLLKMRSKWGPKTEMFSFPLVAMFSFGIFHSVHCHVVDLGAKVSCPSCFDNEYFILDVFVESGESISIALAMEVGRVAGEQRAWISWLRLLIGGAM
jgi:hypothetical protein